MHCKAQISTGDLFKTRKAPGVLDPTIVVPPLGCKIYYAHSRYKP